MKFGIITHAIHKTKGNLVYAYEPYVREMNLWANYVDEILIIAPVANENINDIEISYKHKNLRVIAIPNFDITSIKNFYRAILVLPKICKEIYMVMKEVNHIHLRCPGNIGLLGCLVQIMFPTKTKTAKYAGNWDPNSIQPITYKFQRWILSNTFLTKNIKVLVYGEWPNQTKNILPFFTASYKESEIEGVKKKNLNSIIYFVFVGSLSKGKQPLLSVKACHELINKGYKIQLDIYGDGVMRNDVENYIKKNELEKKIILHGNVNKEIVKLAFIKAHFLIFISKSEGWPKVVAEAMFWRCLPISTNVSCVNYMLGYNSRGSILGANVKTKDIVFEIENYLKDETLYQEKVKNAQKWSQNYTLDKFRIEIKNILNDE
ncbi:glycosyltransferase [uncultured Polaribacter sp.]|uniref:glycosyltransferase n=1 Tax=uncultured Polaribacter sp. TaxID=174711 RepID=UPI0026281120|nr:glycosyltransferase [uncultured Polaribacter sp.]